MSSFSSLGVLSLVGKSLTWNASLFIELRHTDRYTYLKIGTIKNERASHALVDFDCKVALSKEEPSTMPIILTSNTSFFSTHR